MNKNILLFSSLILFILLIIYINNLNNENFSDEIEVYISLTTIPSRIGKIKPILDSIIKQTYKVDKILFNVPYYSERFKKKYELPQFLNEDFYKKKIQVIRSNDYGPATKLLGCLDYFKNIKSKKNKFIIIIDDDRKINRSLIKSLMEKQLNNRNKIIANKGGNQRLNVKIPWGAGGISIPLDLIDSNKIKEYFKIHEDKCRYVDDVFWYKYFVLLNKNDIIYHEKIKLSKETNRNNPLFKEKGALQRYTTYKQKGLNELCLKN